MASKSVLIIEDDEDIRLNMIDVLDAEGYTVLTAENGKLGLDLLRSLNSRELPGCILLDLMMPVMTGKEFLESLTRDHSNDLAKIPIYICSAKGSAKQDLGNILLPLEFLKKPSDIDDLIKAVEKYCRIP